MMSTSSIDRHPATLTGRRFASTRDHLRAELRLLELRVKREIARMTRPGEATPRFDEFSGMYVSAEEIGRYLNGESATAAHASNGQLDELDVEITSMSSTIELQVMTSAPDDDDLRLPTLAERFDLSATECQVLVCCLAPEVDIRFHRYFAYLQNDVALRRPTIQLLTRLVDGLGTDVLDACAALAQSRLRRGRLLMLTDRAAGVTSLAAIQPLVPRSVVEYLMGVNGLDESLQGIAELREPRPLELEGDYARHHASILRTLAERAPTGRDLAPTYISGPEGSGRAALVSSYAHLTGRKLLTVGAADLISITGDTDALLSSLRRDVALHAAVVHISGSEALLAQDDRSRSSVRAIGRALGRMNGAAVILTGTAPSADLRTAIGMSLSSFALPYPSITERAQIWSRSLRCETSADANDVMTDLASKFRFTPGQIRRVLDVVSHESRADGTPGPVAVGQLHRCCREESNQGLLAYAKKITARYGWDDIVLPTDTRQQLEEICNCVKRRHMVYGRWGFDAKFTTGKGLNVLFAGPSGTGKTMSAEIIARDLKLDAYKLDLSCVVSKYVGETERNLARVFEEAETSNSILFFDEADALFGKRSEVKDAHDRYANIEIDFLLQKMDEYEGIVILATNLRANLDSAFTRRLHFVVEFPFPDQQLREGIWQRVYPADTPLHGNVDTGFMARRFQFSGGNIRNIAVASAFLAARNGEPVSMTHVILAARREYQKMGKLCSKSDFGQYYELLRDGDAS